MMKLLPDWKHILRRAWSVRLMALAALLTGIEAVLPFFGHVLPLRWFAPLLFVVVVSAMVARLASQGGGDD